MFYKNAQFKLLFLGISFLSVIFIYITNSHQMRKYSSLGKYLNAFNLTLADVTTGINGTRKRLVINGLCPLIPPNLGKRIGYDLKEYPLTKTIADFKKFSIKPGGYHSPSKCKASSIVAIIIPYRNRETNMKIFMRHMHPFLIKQQIEYRIFLVEPLQKLTFNRGMLMNIGYVEALKISTEFQCFIFHDIDLLPEDERNLYTCPERPRHMSHAVSTLNYRLPYETIFGGVSALTTEQMKKVNGFSNLYFGWGGEDDDFRLRIVRSGYEITRYPIEVGRYKMIKHTRDQKDNKERMNLLQKAVLRFQKEGLNTLKYNLVDIEYAPLFTKIVVDYDESQIMSVKY